MNRNNEAHFNQIPSVHISRSTFKRDQKILTTFNAGKLIPFYVDEVLPGDTFRVRTSAIIRMQTPKFPVMDDAYIDMYYFFVPNRIVWDNFKRFMGEADEKPWAPAKNYYTPKILLTSTKENKMPGKDSILDYMGVPARAIQTPSKVAIINALPVRAYVKIWNEFFRDQNIDNPAVLKTNDENVNYGDENDETNINKILEEAYRGGRCLPVNKFHDYFTSCLPYPQRGPEVTIPMTGNAPITLKKDNQATEISEGLEMILGTTSASNKPGSVGYSKNPVSQKMQMNYNGTGVSTGEIAGGWMYSDLSNVSATTINELRQAIAVQHYYEAMARGGSRYREQVRSIFGTVISDKTVQVPEYLGGGRYRININQIIQAAGKNGTDGTPLGETGAMSVTPINEASFTKSFEEHGFVIGVMCVRHDRTYQQGLERFWSRSDRLDYYVPQFANLGEQPVKKKEIYLAGDITDDETFGYQEAWADYRMKPNRVSGEMRSSYAQSLDSWHYADEYDKVPTLSQEWLKEGKAEIDRTLIVNSQDQFFGGILVENNTTRPMPLYSVPGLERI
nr:MAG TPA: Major capsid protein [Microviridae sp.]